MVSVCVVWVEATVEVQSLQEDVHQEDHLTFWQAIALANADCVLAPLCIVCCKSITNRRHSFDRALLVCSERVPSKAQLSQPGQA